MLAVGTPLYGYCGGIFGRDSYYDKRVEAVGFDWAVVREKGETPRFASGPKIHEDLAPYTSKEETL